MKDGKALLGIRPGGGRHPELTACSRAGGLSLVAPNGMTTVFEASIAGDQLETKGEKSLL
jgi:hypothetical protein